MSSVMHLHAAAARGDLAGIRYALAHGFAIDARDTHDRTALHHALSSATNRRSGTAPRADIDTIRFLLDAGAEPDLTDHLGFSAVQLAAGIEDVTFLNLLQSHGADIRKISSTGYSTLVHAAYQRPGPGKHRVIDRLVSLGADVDFSTEHGETPLSVCLVHGDFAALRHFLTLGANPAPLCWSSLHRALLDAPREHLAKQKLSPATINAPLDRLGHSPWQLAIRLARLDVLDLLVEHGADMAATDRHGRTLLHLAAATDSSALPWLLAHGADPLARDDSDNTPLHIAAETNSTQAIGHLLAAGGEPSAQNAFQQQPINLAHSVPALRLLAQAGGDLNHVDGCGEWPLHGAAQDNDPERVAWLLAQGARVDQSSTGATALHFAMQADAREIITMLLASGASPNAQDVDGWTPFFYAVSREAIHLLRRSGGNPTIRDHADMEPARWLKDRLLRKALVEQLP